MSLDPQSETEPVHAVDQTLVNSLRDQSSNRIVFDRFRLVQELGEGGMGVVWLAEDNRLDQRKVALKFLPGLVVRDAETLTDLRREIRHSLEITHPGVVRVYDLHENREEKLAAIAMEYVEGKTLAELKTDKSCRCFEVEEVSPWLEQLCNILAFVHDEIGMVHRDIKPRNLILTPSGRLKLADFGIAAVISDSHTRLTQQQAGTSGTPCYMSPQQANGEPPKPADDIYAVGATIFELLAGKPPFFRGAMESILHQVRNVLPPSMTKRREELHISGLSGIPEEWERVVAACLCKDPSDRPGSCQSIVKLLEPKALTVTAIAPPHDLPGEQKIFDSRLEDRKFQSWTKVASEGAFEDHFLLSLDPITEIVAIRLSADGTEQVGINKVIKIRSGVVEFTYYARRSSSQALNLLVCVIPMKGTPWTTTLEYEADAPDAPYRTRFVIPKIHIADDTWHMARLPFDFTHLRGTTYSIIGVRINEGCRSPGAGVLSIRDVRVFTQQ